MKRFLSIGVRPALLLIASAGIVGCESTQSQNMAATEHGRAAYLNPESTFAWKGAETVVEPPAPVVPARVFALPEQPERPVSWLAIPTGDRKTSTLLLEKFVPKEVVAGQPFDYDIRVTNLTGSSLSNVMVTDSLPPEFGMKSSDPKPQITGGPSGLTTWVLGVLDPHEVRTIHLTGSGSAAGSISSCASGTYAQTLCTTINVVQPALRLSKVAPSEVVLCDPFDVKLTVTNAGSGVARNVVVTDTFPKGLRTIDGKNAAEFTIPALGAGETKEMSYRVKADHTGVFVNGAVAQGQGGLRAEASEVSTRITQPVLAVSKKGPEQVFLGRAAAFEMVVTNTGDAVAAQTVLDDPLPSGATLVNASEGGTLVNGSVHWNLGALEPKASRTVKMTLNYAAIGDYKNTATARAVCADAASATTSTAMAGVPALLLDGFDDPDPVEVGQNVTYTLNVTNQGSAPLTNVRMICTMDEPEGMAFVNATGPTNAATSGRTITFPVVPNLDAKGRVTYKVTVRAVKAGQMQLKAEVSSDQITRPLVKIETTHFYK